jgi:hypothetical protein
MPASSLMTDDDDSGRVTSVEVTWLYDELYTLILLQDYALDPDFDGALTEAEVAGTLGFDLNWNSGFEGGLVPDAGRRTALDPRRAGAGVADASGPMVGCETDPSGRPVTGDPGHGRDRGTGLRRGLLHRLRGDACPRCWRGPTGCAPDLVRADLDAAYAGLEAELAAIGGAVAAEDNFPAVGALFADRLVFACAP